MNKLKEYFKANKIIKIIFPIAIITLLVAYKFFFRGNNRDITSGIIKEQIQHISELTTAAYNYTAVDSIKDTKKLFLNLNLPFSEKMVIMSVDGRIKAGIDLKDADVKLQDKTIIITLPEPKITSHEIFDETRKIYTEQTQLFSGNFNFTDFTEFNATVKNEKEKRALHLGLLTEAKNSAEKVVTTIVKMLDKNNEYQIKIQYQD